MPWINEQRFRYAKKVQHDSEPGRHRISGSLAPLHYESEIDSGRFDSEINLTPERVNGANLNGWRITQAGWHFAYQGFAATQNQSPLGTLGYGGRQGRHWLTMRPHRIGYMHWPSRSWTNISGAPTFQMPSLDHSRKTIGVEDDDPVSWQVTNSATVTVPDLWTTPGGGSCGWLIKIFGGRIKQDFVINQAARDWVAANAAPTTPADETWFCVALEMDFRNIPRVLLDNIERNLAGDDFDVTDNLAMRDAAGRHIGSFGLGEIFVKNKGGRVDIRKRVYHHNDRWWFVMGANVAQMNQNLLSGDLVIDPAISEESIAASADDAAQANASVSISPAYNRVTIGNYRNSTINHAGFRFQSIPIAQGATINSATLEPLRAGGVNPENVTANVYGNDVDDAAAFTTTNNDITDRTRTTASTVLSGSTDFPGSGRPSWDVASIVGEIVGRGGWSYNNDIAFVVIDNSSVTNYETARWQCFDYAAGATSAADFNVDYTAGGGGADVGQGLHNIDDGWQAHPASKLRGWLQ